MHEWCERAGMTPGALLSLDQTWELSKLWYADRLDPTFRGRTVAQAQAIFRTLGFTDPFWLDESQTP